MYSYRDLAEKAGVGPSTVTALVYGDRRSSEDTIQAVAGALRLPITTIRGWAAAALGDAAPFELPPEANRLTRRERDAVLAVVRAMLEPDDAVAESTAAGGKAATPLAPVRDLHPPAPDLSRVAARRGDSAGRRQRDEQDRAAEEPQDPSRQPHQ